MKLKRIVSLSIFLIFILIGVVTAASLPENNPFRVEGNFLIDGGAPTQDYTFTANVNGELYKTLETGADGYYVATVGGYDGDEVKIYVEGVLVCTAEFESYGTYICNVDITEPEEQETEEVVDNSTDNSTGGDTGGSGGSGGSSGGSGSTSGGSSGGGGGSSHSDEATTSEDDGTSSTLGQDKGVDLLTTNVTEEVAEGPSDSNGLAGITGAAVNGIQDFGVGKGIFVGLVIIFVVAGGILYFKKNKKVVPEETTT